MRSYEIGFLVFMGGSLATVSWAVGFTMRHWQFWFLGVCYLLILTIGILVGSQWKEEMLFGGEENETESIT